MLTEPYGKKSSFKYFIGYKDDDVISHYVQSFINDWLC